jgi:uracil-DNA glycosylase
MSDLEALVERCCVHEDWRALLIEALQTLEQDYLQALMADDSWLPGIDRLLAAFRRDRIGLRYLLIGESPYPRPESANGIAFYDAAVGSLWSEAGLSKPVNRATSLRNIVKTALLAEGRVERDQDGKITQQAIAAVDKSDLVETLGELFDNLHRAGFLLMNATPVLHPQRKPAHEARYWRAFLECLLQQIARQAPRQPTLLLWGKIAELIESMPASANYRKLVCEHPYNISFIDNAAMQALFAELAILRKSSSPASSV